MRTVHGLVCTVAAMIGVAVFVPSGNADEPPSSPAAPPASQASPEIVLREMVKDLSQEKAELSYEVAQLKAQNVKLKKDLDAARKHAFSLQAQQGIVAPSPESGNLVVPPAAGTGSVPQSWIQREFNGIRYYIVPLQAGQ